MQFSTVLLAAIAGLASAVPTRTQRGSNKFNKLMERNGAKHKALPLTGTEGLPSTNSSSHAVDKRNSISVTTYGTSSCGGRAVSYHNVQNGCWYLSDQAFWAFSPSGNSGCVIYGFTDSADCGGTQFGGSADGQCVAGTIEEDGYDYDFLMHTILVEC
jgi:hypothetical protein